ncbi:putative GUP1 [Trypanosoma grayi]|uniref:putative GUP1 n=1 Tax=Trypanosoma grayi TaxID=71804 RepID=UPI0004F47C0D|nr:putative GUP1 [Trypanosoma grayi]KEG09498.1 putative GUP1 [Trypanosoma grayi]
MGGSRKKHFSIFPIFFFIAVWHDIELRLIYWAGIVCICFFQEILVTQVLLHPKTRLAIALAKRPVFYRYVRIMGASIGMIQLIVMNLIGFGIGISGAGSNFAALWNEAPISFLLLMFLYFCMASVISIQDRDREQFEEHQNRIRYGLAGSGGAAATKGVVSSGVFTVETGITIENGVQQDSVRYL